MRKPYASDISREKFEEILTVDLYDVFCGVLYLLRSGCQWRMLPRDFPKWRTVHSYFAKWSEPDPDGISVLERALKKSGWRGPREIGAQRHAQSVNH
jgi:transposase